jgi:hypothetical protein
MSTFQTLISIVLLIFILSVIVQAVNEFVKKVLDTKAKEMKKTITAFMGNHLTLDQVNTALRIRGLGIKAIENLSKDDFRHLLDGITFQANQLTGIVTGIMAQTEAEINVVKDNIAASYEAARTSFQQTYTKRNKLFATVVSFILVFLLNANIIILYEQVSADQVAQQAIMGKAALVNTNLPPSSGQAQSQQTDLGAAYSHSLDQIVKVLKDYPILMRTTKYPEDFNTHLFIMIIGLVIMGSLVSLGAPFWNDILKGMMGINSALNSNVKNTS